ncbi:DEAD/DEAH box helicase [Catenuloplanes indicus]|uniref:Type III restriction enzyme n=1 Tax=Catenuloplanes indicus TaxID=137267 RepID=A0AAE3W639_9ACTN|nr:DEAD/DEAH box helicase family protein [Catenuloplanes indicus]MDQ0369442.1 type III restriction enzyme [Catenuloplanes indicus]
MSDWLPYDAGLVAQIAAAMDLRAPNAAALAAAARAVAPGDGREVVCELATGVGKSYVSAALVDYLAERGVRHVLIVTPGTAIRDKTIGNFTPGHPRFVPGADHPVSVVTGPAPPQDGLTLYVFTVQQLIRPGATVNRRLRAVDETLGAGLYQRLAETDDLVVVADEHHVYREAARAFGAAVRDLAPRALIGFTATPDRADRDRVVFRYPLAAAITDGLVSVPVLVGAPDHPAAPDHPTAPDRPAAPDHPAAADREGRLWEACRLRAAKEVAWHAWAAAHGVPPVTPLIFVVCRVVNEAAQVADVLAGLLPGDGRVLLVTSRSSDDALRALARVSETDSPVRAVVAVDKLSSGWDVPNVGVILALRALASETLTEQVLGRGLRLPYGRRVGVPAVDAVDVLTHESYRELLAGTDELRAAIAPGSRGTVAHAGDEATLTVGAAPLLRISGYDRALTAARTPIEPVPPPDGEAPDGKAPVPLRAARFSLAAIPTGAAYAIGAGGVEGLGAADTGSAGNTARFLIDGAGSGGADSAAGLLIDGRPHRRDHPEAVQDLTDRLLALPLVEATIAEVAEATRLAGAYLAGRSATPDGNGGDGSGGGARWDTAAADRATDALAELIAAAYRRRR